MQSIDKVRKKIVCLQGEQFETKTGLPFIFEISGDTFHPSRTKYNILKSDFSKALDLVPFAGPGTVNELVRGPAYIWPRVREDNW